MTLAASLLLWLLGLPGAAPGWAHAGVRENVGPPAAPHAMPGVDATRSRRTTTKLSAAPAVSRRLRVAYGVGRGLVTRGDGGFFVLHPSARASRLDARGKLIFSLKLPAEPASAAVVTSNGRFAFVSAGELQIVDEQGRVSSRTSLGDADFTARSILASRDGGVVLASNSRLLQLSAFGELVWRRSIPETPLELLETDAGMVCVTALGSVYRLDGAGRLSKLGELGGNATAVTAARGQTLLLARTGSHRLVKFDLSGHRASAIVDDAAMELDGPLLLDPDGLAQAFSADGLLMRYRSDGSEAQRVPLDPGSRKAPGMESALILADGRLLVARPNADVAVVSASGEVTSVPSSACPDPVGVFSAGAAAVLVACRSGNVLRLE